MGRLRFALHLAGCCPSCDGTGASGGFISPDSAICAADMAEKATGAPMEVFKLPRIGWGYRPAETEVAA